MLRYIKHSSIKELSEKLAHLKFPLSHIENFCETPASFVLFDRRASLSKESAYWLKQQLGARFIYHSGGALLGLFHKEELSSLSLEHGPPGLAPYMMRAKQVISSVSSSNPLFKARDRVLDLRGKPPHLMGIINISPDSFSDGGMVSGPLEALDKAQLMVEGGASIIDIGGESTRPGAKSVSTDEEIERVIPVIELISNRVDALISIDTRKAEVAEAALSSGAHMVNDISGLRQSEEMASVAARYDAGICIMHMKGKPETMQENPTYESLTDEVLEQLGEGISRAKKAGIREDHIMVDPGLGFGKRYMDNLYIIKNLEEFRSAGYVLLIGHSRKSFIGLATGKPVHERLLGGAAALALAVFHGADIIRVHDVAEMRDALLMAWEIKESEAC